MYQDDRTVLGAVSIFLGSTGLFLQITATLVLSLCLLSCPGTRISSEFIPVESMLLLGMIGGVLLSSGLWVMKIPRAKGTGKVIIGAVMILLGTLIVTAGMIYSTFLYQGFSFLASTTSIVTEAEIAFATGTMCAVLIVTGSWGCCKQEANASVLRPWPRDQSAESCLTANSEREYVGHAFAWSISEVTSIVLVGLGIIERESGACCDE